MREGRRGAADELVRLQIRANPLGHPRVGLTVGKQLGGAVERNRLRRRIRAAAAVAMPHLGSWDIVIVPSRVARSASWPSLAASVDGCLKRAGAHL